MSPLVWRGLSFHWLGAGELSVQVVSLQTICSEYIQRDQLAKASLPLMPPKLHLLMHFIWQAVCNTASDLERDKWWIEMGRFLTALSPFSYFIFYECRRVYSRGPHFPDQGGSIFLSIMCLYGRAFAFEV